MVVSPPSLIQSELIKLSQSMILEEQADITSNTSLETNVSSREVGTQEKLEVPDSKTPYKAKMRSHSEELQIEENQKEN